MPHKPVEAPFPDSPGAWLACFRHRVRTGSRALSPEEFGPLIGRSGATVRRWERNRQLPEEKDIARLAQVCCLTPMQTAFLSAACTRMRAMPAPNARDFRAYMGGVLSSTCYPAMLLDGLFYVRAWNSYMDAVAPGSSGAFRQDIHPMAMLLRAGSSSLLNPYHDDEILRAGLRIFWMNTAVHSHRPEYADLLRSLDKEPEFRRLWVELATGGSNLAAEPISFAHSLGGSGARFKVYSRTITFPPTYYLHEYQPDDQISRERLRKLVEAGPPVVSFKRRLHWVKADCD